MSIDLSIGMFLVTKGENMSKIKAKADLINRIRTIKGHLSGVEKMIDEDKPCEDILFQISAVKSSMNKMGNIFLENYAKECILERKDSDDGQAIDDIIKSIIKYSK
jgi:DNA-binding FrmR family transcriptional regulator